MDWYGVPAALGGASASAGGADRLACGERAARTVACEIARLRGWRRAGDETRALRALDGALRALADLDAAAAATPEWRGPARELRAQLDAEISRETP